MLAGPAAAGGPAGGTDAKVVAYLQGVLAQKQLALYNAQAGLAQAQASATQAEEESVKATRKWMALKAYDNATSYSGMTNYQQTLLQIFGYLPTPKQVALETQALDIVTNQLTAESIKADAAVWQAQAQVHDAEAAVAAAQAAVDQAVSQGE
jgi:hypothetical protein